MTMLSEPGRKYRPFPPINLPDRQWPSRTITHPPRWLSTDLRDGNQAIVDPMDAVKKHRFFDLLVEIGVKEIEIGFPAAGQTEFDFIHGLVRSGTIPDDVTVQVLTQAREDLIKRSFESLEGSRSAIVHVYNALSPAWREIVFRMTRDEVRQIAVNAAKLLRDEAAKRPETEWHFEYSPETFSTAELDFSLETCAAVMEVLQPTKERPLILNLPATVEAATPNVYADQIEYFCRNLPNREAACISLHTHNDAAPASPRRARADGQRRPHRGLPVRQRRAHRQPLPSDDSSQHVQFKVVDPGLDFSDIDRIIETVEYCNHSLRASATPMAASWCSPFLFGQPSTRSRRGFEAHAVQNDGYWRVFYLPIATSRQIRAHSARR